MRKTHDKHPSGADVLYTLVIYSRNADGRKQAITYANKLLTLVAANPDIEKQVHALKAIFL